MSRPYKNVSQLSDKRSNQETQQDTGHDTQSQSYDHR